MHAPHNWHATTFFGHLGVMCWKHSSPELNTSPHSLQGKAVARHDSMCLCRDALNTVRLHPGHVTFPILHCVLWAWSVAPVNCSPHRSHFAGRFGHFCWCDLSANTEHHGHGTTDSEEESPIIALCFPLLFYSIGLVLLFPFLPLK